MAQTKRLQPLRRPFEAGRGEKVVPSQVTGRGREHQSDVYDNLSDMPLSPARMPTELRTPRLHLRPLNASDSSALHGLWTHPDVRRYLWDDVVIPPEQTAAIIAESERLFATEGYGLWGARLPEEPGLVGFGGFWYFRDPPELELLFGIAAPRWGQGLATELAARILRFGLDRVGLTEVRASTDAPNAASVRVLEKLGFVQGRRATVAGLDTLFFCFRG